MTPKSSRMSGAVMVGVSCGCGLNLPDALVDALNEFIHQAAVGPEDLGRNVAVIIEPILPVWIGTFELAQGIGEVEPGGADIHQEELAGLLAVEAGGGTGAVEVFGERHV